MAVPVITPVPPKLQDIRDRKDLKLRPTKHLKDTFTDFDGIEKPLHVRYYQVQGILHLVVMPRFLLGDDTGLGKCKTLDSLILTDQGLISLGDLAPRGVNLIPDTFYDLDQPTQVWTGWEWAPIKRFYYCGSKSTIRIKTRRGYETTGSKVHPLWTRLPYGEQFVKMSDLQKNDFVALDRSDVVFPTEEPILPVPKIQDFKSPTKFYKVPDQLNPDLATFLGYLVSEGWTNNKYAFHVSQDPVINSEVHQDIQRLCDEVLNYPPALSNEGAGVNSVYLRSYLEGLGIDHVLSKDKRVPWPIFQGTKESVTAFLRAFFDGEASVMGGVLEVSSASEQLLKEIQILLLRFGILSTRSSKMVKGRSHVYWRLSLCGDDARSFRESIGLLTPRKQAALDELIDLQSNPNLDVVPYAKDMVDVLRSEILARSSKRGSNEIRKGSGIKQFGISFEKTLNNIRNYGRNPTYQFLDKLLKVSLGMGVPKDHPACNAVREILDRHFFYDPIVDITESVEQLADIEVDNPRHCFVADGFVNHNTLETIAALCYIWERDPNQKVIIITTKSAAMQWMREFGKFTKGVKVILSRGSPAQRGQAREMFTSSTGPTVIIMGYRSAVQDFTHLQNWQGHTLVMDECFDYHTPITLADGTTELIGKIVCQKLPVEVLSKNPVTGAVEPKRVLGWFRNPFASGSRKHLLKINFRLADSVRVTRSHKFYRSDGREVEAARLHKGDEVQHLSLNCPTNLQMQVILGSLLGDGGLCNPDRPQWGVTFVQSQKHPGYLDFKRQVLYPLGVSLVSNGLPGFPLKDEGSGIPVERFSLHANDFLTSVLVQARIRRDHKKHVTKEWLDLLDPLGLAVWYADDGSLNVHTCPDGTQVPVIALHTEGFSKDEQELLAGWLHWKWGIEAQVKTSRERTDRNNGTVRKAYPYLYLNKDNAKRFLDLLPGSFPGVEYKFPGKSLFKWTPSEVTPTRNLVTDWVTSSTPCSPQKLEKYVYNIEVEDNHNYIAGGVLVSNCTAFKNHKTQVHQVCRHLSTQANRSWGLTATLIKNNLMEGWGIYQVVVPGLFNMTYNNFMMYFAITRMQKIPRSNRQIPMVVGYYPDKITEFRNIMDAFFLGRPKHLVASELPSLTSMHVEVDMSDEQEEKYAEALTNLLTLGNDDKAVVKEVTKLTALIYCQEIVNDLQLINCEGGSPKLDALIDILTEGDLAEEKVIIFSRFSKMVNIIMRRLEAEKIKAVRVTGDEDENERDAAKTAFQNPNSDVRVICITTAGSEAINLQAAKALVCYDTPWSAGDFLQLIGRMIRIGSKHDRVFCIHLISKGRRKKDTIDSRVMEVLGKKMHLVEAVLGKRIKGDGDQLVIDVENEISNLFDTLKGDAK